MERPFRQDSYGGMKPRNQGRKHRVWRAYVEDNYAPRRIYRNERLKARGPFFRHSMLSRSFRDQENKSGRLVKDSGEKIGTQNLTRKGQQYL